MNQLNHEEKYKLIKKFLDHYMAARQSVYLEITNATIFKLLKLDVPYKNIVDLTINCYVKCYDNGKELIVDIDENAMDELLGLNFEDTFKLAYENTKNLVTEFPEKNLPGFDDPLLEAEFYETVKEFFPYNTDWFKRMSAQTLLYPEVLKGICEEIDSNLYIMPVDKHEIILVKEDAKRLDEFKNVQLTNRRVVIDEFLSDRVYKFDRESLKLILL